MRHYIQRFYRPLQDEVRRLKEESNELQVFLHNHLSTCPLVGRSGSPPDVKPFQEPYPYPAGEGGVRVKEEALEPQGEPVTMEPVINLDSDVFVSPTTDKRSARSMIYNK